MEELKEENPIIYLLIISLFLTGVAAITCESIWMYFFNNPVDSDGTLTNEMQNLINTKGSSIESRAEWSISLCVIGCFLIMGSLLDKDIQKISL